MSVHVDRRPHILYNLRIHFLAHAEANSAMKSP